MRITARFPGRCRSCMDSFAEGDRIEWTQGAGATCLACSGPDRTAPPRFVDPDGTPEALARSWASVTSITSRNRGRRQAADTVARALPPLDRCRVHDWLTAPGSGCPVCGPGA